MLQGYELKCIDCGSSYEADAWLMRCPKCDGLLEARLKSVPDVSWELFRSRRMGVWRYRELLPKVRSQVTMGEGGTPLVDLEGRLLVKFEGLNPTGSFKDRGMSVAISLAREIGVRSVVCASTGNTAASMSAYAARAGLKSFVVLPKGKVAKGKLAQAALHGAVVLEIEGSFDDALRAVMGASGRSLGLYPLNSFNPWRLEGQKTLAYEIADEIGIPDWVVLPVGNAGNISAIWKGFKELRDIGLVDELPRLIGVQAEGASPIVRAYREGRDEPLFTDNPETIATAIRIGRPVNWPKAMRALRESDGLAVEVSDQEILEAQRRLGRMGIGVEPASASPYAAYLKLLGEEIDPGDTVVLVATGHALKDPDILPFPDAVRVRDSEEAINFLRGAMT
ncbi:MAG: threonine synthase [Candidatus Korarchaeota archaeon NZ13-K]|nr:MAG: threonine synthase [Candidatus Korarchaeota archaeon NZ13-K]